MQDNNAINALLKRLNYDFKNTYLLETALTHRSYSANNNERLEFLGDGILNFVIADELFKLYPDRPEGDLSRLRASLVNKDTLAEISLHLKLSNVIKLGSGELKSGGYKRPSILADAVESILGAVYCDGGFAACQQLIKYLYKDKLNVNINLNRLKDPKTQLQELLQSHRLPLPDYQVTKISGQSHAQLFHVVCLIEKLKIQVTSEGKSRRKAEQIAAEKAIVMVENKLKK